MAGERKDLAALRNLRNIGIIAHIDAGKTTTTERMLYYSGKQHRIGAVDQGTATMDWRKEEQERGITITAAATRIRWKGADINIIDTPGHVDFTIEVERSLRVLDGAVGVFCAVGGVEAQSETVWRQADRYHVPRLAYINKLDRVGADLEACMKAMREKLYAHPLLLQMPDAVEGGFQGVFDLVTRQYILFGGADGSEVEEREIPAERREEVEQARAALIEEIGSLDDALLERYLEDEASLKVEEIRAAVKRLTLIGNVTPVFCGSSLHNKGVQPLMDGVVHYLPAPTEVPAMAGVSAKTGKTLTFPCDPAAPPCALVFKLWAEPHGFLHYARVYSGTLRSGMALFNPRRKKRERIARILRMHANVREDLSEASAGDIVVLTGPKDTTTGDTLCSEHDPALLENIHFTNTVVARVIEPKTSADRERLLQAIERIGREDPSFEWKEDPETGQFIISGMGELHLEVSLHRMLDDFKVEANMGQLRVSYREAPTKPARVAHHFEATLGGADHAAGVTVEIVPNKEEPAARFESALPPGRLKEDQIEIVREGILAAATSGCVAGYPLIHLVARVLEVELFDARSTLLALSHAASTAFNKALGATAPTVLEPIMRLEAVAPEEHIGAVIRDLGSRRSEILEMSLRGALKVVVARVPLSELFGYADEVRSITQGRASFSMEPDRYSPVPPERLKEITGS